MAKPAKLLPVFADEAEERRFWESHDSTEYLDWSKAEPVRLPRLKPSRPDILVVTRDGKPRDWRISPLMSRYFRLP